MSVITESRAASAMAMVFALSLGTIVLAWGFQLLGGYIPCPLCLQQRWPYYAVIALSGGLLALAVMAPERAPLLRVGLIAAALIMLAGAFLGAYHAGVEWKWWPGPAACSMGAGLSGGLPDLDTARVVACDEAQWRFLSLSFAGWNVLVSLLIAALALYGARRTA